MRRRRAIARPVFLAALIALSVVPATAPAVSDCTDREAWAGSQYGSLTGSVAANGCYYAQLRNARGAFVLATVKDGGAFVIIFRQDYVMTFGQAVVLPIPNNSGVPPTNQSLAPPLVSNAGVFYKPALYVGCIGVFIGHTADFGCTLVPPSTVNLDAAYSEMKIAFSVRSTLNSNRLITATLLLKEAGPPTVYGDVRAQYDANKVTVTASPPKAPTHKETLKPAAKKTDIVHLSSLASFLRPGKVSGFIRSEAIGGGKVRSPSTSLMILGAAGQVSVNTDKVFCLGGTTCEPV